VRERAEYACDPETSRGRQHAEPDAGTRGPRTAFQRDRDRIIHSIPFRRLRHKTQVFVAPDGDHFRVRLTHSIEVAQIGRTIARALGLDEDLTEALCLAHDIGHPPFGHAGEDALSAALGDAGGFDHNGHTLRILTQIEHPYPRWPGLNLSWEMLEGLAKHNGPMMNPGWALAGVDAAYRLDLTSHASLEAQVAAIADDIAYDNHDIDDGLRAGLLDFEALISVPLVAHGWGQVCARFADCDPSALRAELVRHQIGTMVNDVIEETERRIRDSRVRGVDDVRRAGHALVGFSEKVAEGEKALKAFMYANLYHHPRQLEIADTCRVVAAGLFDVYSDDAASLPAEWQASLPMAQPERSRHIADCYAIARYRECVGPIDLPEGF
jgi:dGTPase